MSKFIKLKKSDLQNIIKEAQEEFDDFETQIQPEELPEPPQDLSPEDLAPEGNQSDEDLKSDMEQYNHRISDILIGKDDEGKVIVVNTKTGQILGIK